MNELEQLSTRILEHHASTQSWDKTGIEFGLNKAMARLIATGYKPGKKIRKVLGLPDFASVVIVGVGDVPPGTQVIKADKCACGMWYVSNSPRRKRCFICSPCKRKSVI